MALNRLIALSLSAVLLASTPALAAGFPVPALGLAVANPELVQIRYVRRRAIPGFPAALAAGVIAGIVGGAISGGCYFNDCGYDNSGVYYGGYNGGYNGGYVGSGGYRGHAYRGANYRGMGHGRGRFIPSEKAQSHK